MKKFIYRFQSILNLREKQEEQAKIHYGNMLAALHREEDKLEELKKRKSGYEDKKRSLVSAKLNVTEIISMDNAIEYIKEAIEIQKLEIKKAEKRVEAAREALNEAITQRKTYEKLKEKDFEKYKLEYEAEERKEIDQLVSYVYSTGGSDGT